MKTLAVLLAHRDAPDGLLCAAADTMADEPDIVDIMFKRMRLPAQALRSLARDADASRLVAVLSHDSTPDELRRELIDGERRTTVLAAAAGSDVDLPEDVLDRLVEHGGLSLDLALLERDDLAGRATQVLDRVLDSKMFQSPASRASKSSTLRGCSYQQQIIAHRKVAPDLVSDHLDADAARALIGRLPHLLTEDTVGWAEKLRDILHQHPTTIMSGEQAAEIAETLAAQKKTVPIWKRDGIDALIMLLRARTADPLDMVAAAHTHNDLQAALKTSSVLEDDARRELICAVLERAVEFSGTIPGHIVKDVRVAVRGGGDLRLWASRRMDDALEAGTRQAAAAALKTILLVWPHPAQIIDERYTDNAALAEAVGDVLADINPSNMMALASAFGQLDRVPVEVVAANQIHPAWTGIVDAAGRLADDSYASVVALLAQPGDLTLGDLRSIIESYTDADKGADADETAEGFSGDQ